MSDAELLGNELREARQQRALTIEQAEKETRIRAKYIEAMERADFASLPSIVHARGFLRNYARYLGLDGDLIVARFDTAIKGGRRRGRRVVPEPEDPTLESTSRRTLPSRPIVPTPIPTIAEEEGRRRRSAWLTTLLIGLIALVLLAVLFIFGSQWMQAALSRTPSGGVILSPLPQETELTSAPTSAVTEASTQPPRPTPLPIPGNTPTPPGTGGVAVNLQIVERTWLLVVVDGQQAYLGSAPPDTILQFRGNKIQIRASNGAGVHALVNGQDKGLLGARGQIVDLTYTASGAIPPTSVPTQPTTNSSGVNSSSTVTLTVSVSPLATGSETAPGLSASVVALLSATPISPTPRARASPTITILPTYIPPSPTRTFTPTATSTITLTPTSTATFTATPTASMTLTPTATFTPSQTPTPSNTPRPSATFTPSITPTSSNTPLFLPRDTSTPKGGDIRGK